MLIFFVALNSVEAIQCYLGSVHMGQYSPKAFEKVDCAKYGSKNCLSIHIRLPLDVWISVCGNQTDINSEYCDDNFINYGFITQNCICHTDFCNGITPNNGKFGMKINITLVFIVVILNCLM